jgi:hypothetical protein
MLVIFSVKYTELLSLFIPVFTFFFLSHVGPFKKLKLKYIHCTRNFSPLSYSRTYVDFTHLSSKTENTKHCHFQREKNHTNKNLLQGNFVIT